MRGRGTRPEAGGSQHGARCAVVNLVLAPIKIYYRDFTNSLQPGQPTRIPNLIQVLPMKDYR